MVVESIKNKKYFEITDSEYEILRALTDILMFNADKTNRLISDKNNDLYYKYYEYDLDSIICLLKNNNFCLIVTGADLMDKTEIYDIKPYIRFTDSHDDAISGFVDETQFPELNITNAEMLDELDNEIAENIKAILSSDPRPAYQNDESRIYGFEFGEYNIKFKVKDSDLTVVSIDNE